jgi:hypothetical protein
MCDVCKKTPKKLGVCWGLVDKISPAFELRNPDVPVPAGSRQVDVEVGTYRSPTKAGAVGRHILQSSVVPVSFPFFSVTVLPSSPAYTHLKQHLKPLQIFNQKIWPCKKPFLAGKTFPSPKLKPPAL